MKIENQNQARTARIEIELLKSTLAELEDRWRKNKVSRDQEIEVVKGQIDAERTAFAATEKMFINNIGLREHAVAIFEQRETREEKKRSAKKKTDPATPADDGKLALADFEDES